jgi:anthranilate synthase/aminodeoxychorismate synthase-like glutamine amidotransferase
MILLLDHEDSFVFNLARYVEELGQLPRVVRVGTVSLAEVTAMRPERIILSPGPGTPADCPLALAVIRQLGPEIPILGVCLGHQCIAAAYGASVTRARQPRHGLTSAIRHDGRGVFAGLPSPFLATRYHSLAIAREGIPEELELTAFADDGEIMGARHRLHPVEGVQFHPESVSSEHGHQLLENFLRPVAHG